MRDVGTDGCPVKVSVVCLSFAKSRRLGDGSKQNEAAYKRYRMHSLCFLMKTRLRHPHLPPGQRQMPFYTQPHFAKNQSALALGILQRTDRPPAFWQGILTLERSGRVGGGEAQGGCACCAVCIKVSVHCVHLG